MGEVDDGLPGGYEQDFLGGTLGFVGSISGFLVKLYSCDTRLFTRLFSGNPVNAEYVLLFATLFASLMVLCSFILVSERIFIHLVHPANNYCDLDYTELNLDESELGYFDFMKIISSGGSPLDCDNLSGNCIDTNIL